MTVAVVFSWIESVLLHSALSFGASYSDCCIVGDILCSGDHIPDDEFSSLCGSHSGDHIPDYELSGLCGSHCEMKNVFTVVREGEGGIRIEEPTWGT